MNKSGLIDAVSKTTSLAKREAEEAVNALVHVVSNEVRSGRRVVVAGFGSFNPTRRAARMGRNPQTGAPVSIAPARGVRFAASAMLKDILNGRATLAAPKVSPAPATATRAGTKKAGTKKAGTKRAATKKAAVKKAAGRKVAKKAPARAAKKVSTRKVARVATRRATKKVVGRAPAKKAVKRAPARKAARPSARKAAGRPPARNAAKRPAKKAVRRA